MNAMYWIQLATFALFSLLILALLAGQMSTPGLRLTRAQHAGASEGAYSVWHLIADVEAERQAEREKPRIPTGFPTTDLEEAPTGRHHLRA